MINFDVKNNISFQAKVGKNLLKTVRSDFNYDQCRVDKFVRLVEDTFQNNVDENFVIDIDKNKNFVFSHLAEPTVKYSRKTYYNANTPIAYSIITECSKNIANGEFMLFKNIISHFYNKGKSLDEILEFGKNLTRDKSKESFSNLVNVSKKIKEENPQSKLKLYEFDMIELKIAEEEIQTEGTDLNKMIKAFDIKFAGNEEGSSMSFFTFHDMAKS